MTGAIAIANDDIIAYFLHNKADGSPRLPVLQISGLIYMADWMLAVYDKRTFTNLNWKFTSFGPEQPELQEYLLTSNKYNVSRYGDAETVSISLSEDFKPEFNFSKRESIILEHVNAFSNKTKYNLDSLKHHLSNSYPVVTSTPSDNYHNLLNFVDEFRELLKEKDNSISSSFVTKLISKENVVNSNKIKR